MESVCAFDFYNAQREKSMRKVDGRGEMIRCMTCMI